MFAHVYVDGSYCQDINFGCTAFYVYTLQGRYLYHDSFYGKAHNLELFGTIRVLKELRKWFPFITSASIKTDYRPCEQIFKEEIKARRHHKLLAKAIKNTTLDWVEIVVLPGHTQYPSWHDLNFRKVDQYARRIMKEERTKK